MVKINLMRICALALSVFFMGTSAEAQTKIWGVGSVGAVGVADAEFSNAFTNATAFVAGDNPTTWTALSVNESGGAVTPGNAYWVRNLTGYSNGAYWSGTTPISSPSQVNGVALFDSDFLDNAGTPGAFGTGTSPSVHRGELISPRIDLTGYTDSALTVQFFTWYRDFQQTELSVSISVDDGQTWVETADFRAAVPNLTEDFARILLANATAGAVTLSQCRIRFTFDGDYYFAIVDDITIETSPAYDIALGGPEPGANNVGGAIDNAKMGSNRYNALENVVHALDLREFLWGSKATNLGYENLTAADSAAIHINVDFTDNFGSTTPSVYTDVMYYDSMIVAGDVVGQTVVDYFDDINFTAVHGAGDYVVTYWLDHKNPDGNTANDTVRHTYTLTDDSAPLRNYVSKTRLGTDNGPFSSRAIFPGGGPYTSWEYGSVYFFPRGAMDTITIDSVIFRYRLTGGFSGAAAQNMFCNVYELDPSDGVLTDGTFLTQIGIGTISLTGLGTTVPAGDYALATATSFINATGSGPMPGLNDNGFYYVSILTNPGLTGGAATFDSDDVPWIGADEINYALNANQTAIDSVINPSPINLVDASNISTWNWVGFGADIVPSIGLYLDIKAMNPFNSVSTVYDSEGATFSVYPNPATDVLNFSFETETATDVMYILTDVSGRVLNVTQSANVTSDTQSLDISRLAAGVYMLTAKSAEQNWTKKVVID